MRRMLGIGLGIGLVALGLSAASSSIVKVATVNGLVCDVCAEAIRGAMLREPGVQAVKIDLANRTVTTTLAPDSPLTDDGKLTALLHEAGYDASKVETLAH